MKKVKTFIISLILSVALVLTDFAGFFPERTVSAYGALDIILNGDDFVYNGKPHVPEVTVKDGNTVIPESEYDVSYSDNVNAGTATVTVTDRAGGNYEVNGSKTFTIKK